MSREAIIFTVGAWFGGGLVALVMSMAFMRMIANDRTIGKPTACDAIGHQEGRD